jgi:hypothetical protein
MNILTDRLTCFKDKSALLERTFCNLIHENTKSTLHSQVPNPYPKRAEQGQSSVKVQQKIFRDLRKKVNISISSHKLTKWT